MVVGILVILPHITQRSIFSLQKLNFRVDHFSSLTAIDTQSFLTSAICCILFTFKYQDYQSNSAHARKHCIEVKIAIITCLWWLRIIGIESQKYVSVYENEFLQNHTHEYTFQVCIAWFSAQQIDLFFRLKHKLMECHCIVFCTVLLHSR